MIDNTSLIEEQFTQPLLAWYDKFGRKDLPWQHPRTPYRVWVSEIMLQQTQVQTVIPYFLHFITQFPTVIDLAHAKEDEVLALWSGLGYYSRARHLHQTASIIADEYHGNFPNNQEQLTTLPGIGPSTAAAILSLGFNQQAAILDGNVKRVLSRYFMIPGLLQKASVTRQLWHYAYHCLPKKNQAAAYTQAIMDLGATCCRLKQPQCPQCPLNANCLAYQHHRVNEFPHKKPKKINPVKEQQCLLLWDDKQRVYLEKRPSTGLWGGLWSLPMISMTDEPSLYAQQHYELKTKELKKLLSIKHAFSHFTLHINAVALFIPSLNHYRKNESANGQWFYESDLNQLGLAKPIRTILDYFFTICGANSFKAATASG